MWRWRRKPIPDGFPESFKVQRIRTEEAIGLAELPPADIVKQFRGRPELATTLLHESYDKRFTPSSFIEEQGAGFRVGWVTSDAREECVREFSELADAATDYLLFSLGKGRWSPPE